VPKFIDFSGRRIGRVNVIENVERGYQSRWKCLCDCGIFFICLHKSFSRGDTFECNECRYERRRGVDLTGRRFGRWTVLKREVDQNNKTVWNCRCDCGVEGAVSTYALGRKGKSMSCGCLGRKEKSKWVNTTLYPPSHKKADTKFYRARTGIVHKCYKEKHPSFHKFGGNGITVCDLWRNGVIDMEKWATSNGWQTGDIIVLKEGCREFNPENCQVISEGEFRSEIALANGVQLTYKGETHSISKWADLLDVCKASIVRKLKICPPVEQVFESYFRKCPFLRDPSLVKKVVDLYSLKKTQAEIAKELKVSAPTIRYHLLKEGITLRDEDRKKLKKPNVKTEDIIDLYNQGLSFVEIEKRLGISNNNAAKRLIKLGIYKRRK
jgi:hypothetical protein